MPDPLHRGRGYGPGQTPADFLSQPKQTSGGGGGFFDNIFNKVSDYAGKIGELAVDVGTMKILKDWELVPNGADQAAQTATAAGVPNPGTGGPNWAPLAMIGGGLLLAVAVLR